MKKTTTKALLSVLLLCSLLIFDYSANACHRGCLTNPGVASLSGTTINLNGLIFTNPSCNCGTNCTYVVRITATPLAPYSCKPPVVSNLTYVSPCSGSCTQATCPPISSSVSGLCPGVSYDLVVELRRPTGALAGSCTLTGGLTCNNTYNYGTYTPLAIVPIMTGCTFSNVTLSCPSDPTPAKPTDPVLNGASSCLYGTSTPTPSYSETTVGDGCNSDIVITRLWEFTNVCGAVTNSCSYTITKARDASSPTWNTAANSLNRSVNCDNAGALSSAQNLFPVANDNCDNDVTNLVKTSGALIAGSCPQEGTYTNTWTVNDDCGNTSSVYTQTITIQDTVKPTWTTAVAALDVTLNCDDVAGLTAAQAATPIASDNCDNNVTNIVKTSGAFTAGACPQAGTYTNTWTVTDDCGNVSDVFTQTITIQDTVKPVWTIAMAALDVTLNCDDATGLTAAQAAAPVASDNCDNDVTNIVKTAGAFTAGACPQAGTYTNTWTVTDDCGNVSDVFTQTITIQDTVKPVWTTAMAALDVTVNCDDAAGLTTAQAATPVASDNCDNNVTNIVKTAGSFTAGACPQAGTYTNTWTITDDCGNVSDIFTQTITIQDTTKPAWTTAIGALDATVNCDDPTGLANAQAATPVASDNCDNDVTNIVKTAGAFTAGACPQAGTYTNTWTVTDDCGNVSDVITQTITIQDTVGPSWTTPAGSLDATVECSDSARYMMIHMQRPNVMDNCTPFGNLTEVVVIDSHYVDPLCSSSEIHTHRWKWIDECGNESPVWEMIVTITDTTKPSWTTAVSALDVTLNCDDAAGLTAAQAAAPVASDNCDNDVTNIVKTSGAFTAGACPQAGTYTNTWTVTDDCGNVSDVFTQTITIQDTVGPSWTTPAGSLNATVECSDSARYMMIHMQRPNVMDNCTPFGNLTEVVVIDSHYVDPLCASSEIHTHRWKWIDECGNESPVWEMIVTITDTTKPSWTTAVSALDVTLNCDDAAGLTAAQAAAPVASDNCDNDVTNIVKTAGTFTAGACPQAGTYTNTWTITDDCGNVSDVFTQVITIQDTVKPAWTTAIAALDVTINCDDAAGLTTAQAAAPVASDNCDNDVTNIVKTAGTFTAGACPQAGTYTNTWTITDDCGNISDIFTQTITIQDTVKPSWTTAVAALDVTLNCDDAAGLTAAQASAPVASDNCDNDVTNIVKTAGTFTAGACPQAGTYTNTWTTTDDCGNISDIFTQTITIQDTVKPSWTTAVAALDVTLNCDDAAGLTAAQASAPVASDNCDTDVTNIIKTAGTFTAGTCPQAGTYTNTWTVADDCGNVSDVFTQIITIQDTVKPSWTTAMAALDVTLNCDDAAGLTAAQAAAPIANDNCDNDVSNVVKTSGAFTAGACPQAGTYTNTWTVTDDCGNVSVVFTQTITIQDTVKPAWTTAVSALDVTLNCDDAAGLTSAQAAAPVASDNCDNDVTNIVKTAGAFTSGACPQAGTYTNTWTITDDCGNVSDVFTQVITIQDTVKPAWTTAIAALDVTINCDDAAGLTTAQAAAPVASDNCDNDVTNIVKTAGAFTPGACPQAGTYTNTWTITDDCGNVSDVYTQTITIQDTVKPAWTTAVAALDVTLNCDDAAGLTTAQAAAPVASDNCDNDVTNIVKTAGTFTAGACPQAGTYTNTWTITDDCGNISDVFTQTITIQDTVKPTWTTTAGALDTVLDCDEPFAVLNAVQSLSPVANDNCDTDVSNIVRTAGNFVQDPNCPQAGSITNTWTVTDDCGNISDVFTQTIIIQDTTAPVWVTPVGSLDTTVDCDAPLSAYIDAQAKAPIASDNCSNNLTITKNAGPFVGGACSNAGSYTNTWTTVDDCGNVASVFTQVITVQDMTAPVIDPAPSNLTVNCGDPIPPGVALNATDNCDANVSMAIFTEDTYTPSCAGYTITRRWNASDTCGNNAIERVQTITIQGAVLTIDTITAADVNCFTGDVNVSSSPNIGCAPSGSTVGIKLVACSGCTGAADTIGTIIGSPATFNLAGATDVSFASVIMNAGNEMCSGMPELVNLSPTFCQFPLPVTYEYIQALPADCKTLIEFKTASEVNTKSFEIERSLDGVSFETIGTIFAKNSNSIIYRFEDLNIPNDLKTIYYRLKQIDIDEKFSYSEVLSVRNHCKELAFSATISPNPVSNELRLNLFLSKERLVDMKIVTIVGEVIRMDELSLTKGKHIIPSDVSSLAVGEYILILKDKESREKLQMIKFIKK